MNTYKLHELIDRYESNYALFNDSEHDEVFKWRAVRHFRSVWLSAEKFPDFASLFKEAKKECSVLIDNAQVSPTNGIVKLAEKYPETVEAFTVYADTLDKIESLKRQLNSLTEN